MSGLRSSPKLVKGRLVVLDPASGAISRTIALQYNPDTLTRSYQVQGVGGEGGGERGSAKEQCSEDPRPYLRILAAQLREARQ